MKVGIKSIKSFLPENSVGNNELITQFNVDERFLSDKLGIASRPICSSEEAASDLAVRAASKIFDAGLNKDDIELLIVCTQNPDYKLPNTASILQDRLSLPNHVASFDINQGCSGFIYSLAVAKSMMEVLNYRNSLIITVDPYSKIIDKKDKNTVLLFGDASAAIWLTDHADNEILNFSFGTDGKDFDKLIVKRGGSRYPFRYDAMGKSSENSVDYFLHMNGRAIFNFMMSRVPNDVYNCLKKNSLKMEDIDFFIFHQGSKYMLANLQKTLKISDRKMVMFLENIGNSVSSSIPLAFENLLLNETLSGKTILLSGFGVGLSWGSVVIKC